MSNNRIIYIERSSFQIKKLEYLILQNISSSFALLDVNFEDFSTSLKSLNLNYNHFRNFNPSSKLPRLAEIYLENIQFTSFIDFNNFINLKTIHLCNTNIAQYYSRNVSLVDYLIRNRNVNYLNLSSNNLETIGKLDLFILLVSLDLSNNNMAELEENFLVPLYFLERLILKDNKLESFKFTNLKSKFFKELNLKNNSIKSLVIEDIQVNLDKFWFLDVSFNKLEILEINNPNQVLKYLYFNNNRLKSITDSTLGNLLFAIEINLQFNCIEILERYSFKSLRMLKKLNLASNRIKKLEKETFSNLFDLEYLNLSANKLEIIEKDYFKDLFKLVELDLSANRLRSIEDNALRNLIQVRKIFLNCNYNLILTEKSLVGLNSTRDFTISFGTIVNLQNRNIIQATLVTQIERRIIDIDYYSSINVHYLEEEINCNLTISFLKEFLHLKLKTNKQFLRFSEKCFK